MCVELLAQWRRTVLDTNKLDDLIDVVNGDFSNVAVVFAPLVAALKAKVQTSSRAKVAALLNPILYDFWSHYGYLASVGLCWCLDDDAELRECLKLAGSSPKHYSIVTHLMNWVGLWNNKAKDKVGVASYNLMRVGAKLKSSQVTFKGETRERFEGKIYFQKLKHWIKLDAVIGLGGCGSVIYAGTGPNDEKFAVKEVPEYPDRGGEFDIGMKPFYESLVDPMSICTEVVPVGQSVLKRFTVLELGAPVKFNELALADVVSIMRDLLRLEDYRKAGVTDQIDFKVMLTHLDIHGGNYLRTEKGVRLIDWGVSFVCLSDPPARKRLPSASDSWRITKILREPYLEGGLQEIVEDWLKGIAISDNTKAKVASQKAMVRYGGQVSKIKNVSREMEQCLRVVHDLVFSTTRDIVAAANEKIRRIDITVGYARDVYSLLMTMKKQSKLKPLKDFLIVECLIPWYDTLMLGCLEGTNLTAKDGLKYFSKHLS